MLTIPKLVAVQIVFTFRSRIALQAENALLHYQIDILRRSAPKRVRISRADRRIFKLFLKLWWRSGDFITIVHPRTVVRWHREGFRLYWRWKSRN